MMKDFPRMTWKRVLALILCALLGVQTLSGVFPASAAADDFAEPVETITPVPAQVVGPDGKPSPGTRGRNTAI